MRTLAATVWKVLTVGGWAPLLVFTVHQFADRVLDAYRVWPAFDTPMHFAGGLAIAYFISRCFRQLPRESVQRSRTPVLELILVGTITATAALFWEFAEFTLDQLTGSNVQLNLANTMKDLALGVAGATVFIVIRAVQLRMGTSEVREIADDWMQGRAA